MITSEAVDVGLAGFKKARDMWKAGRADSLIEFSQPTSVEPIVLIGADCIHAEETPDVLQTLCNVFAGYYLRAVSVLATVNNVYIMKQLDRLSPHRDVIENALNSPGWDLLKLESYQDRLPMGNGNGLSRKGRALEAAFDQPDPNKPPQVSVGKDTLVSAKELTNLAVGKLLNVEISDGEHKATVPVSIRLITSSIPTQTLIHILTADTEDFSAKERYHAWRAGRLRFVQDLILCQDLIDARRSAMLADKDGVYTTISKRATQNALSTLVSATPSVATASNMVVMSKREAEELELKLNGRLDDFHTRERMLAPTTIMIIAVIDPLYARVTIYHRSIATATELGIRDIKAANAKGGPDVGDILRAFQIGNAPQY